MFLSLIGKEVKYQFKSITFYVLFGVILLFFMSQFYYEMKIPVKPVRENFKYESADYGKREMEEVYIYLRRDASTGTTYRMVGPINREVRLNDIQAGHIKNAMEKISPRGFIDGKLEIDLSYEEYSRIMDQLDKELGGSTFYSEQYRKNFIHIPETYEEALNDYNNLMQKDKVTGGFGRLFADYMGITAGFFPIFLSAFMLHRSKRSGMNELIDSRSVSSGTYVFSRYIGLCISIMICYLFLAAFSTIRFHMMSADKGIAIDYFALIKYTFLWIGPTVMFTCAAGFIISVIFNNGLPAIPVQFILWMYSISSLEGSYGLDRFVIRFNASTGYDRYIEWMGSIGINRAFYMAVSLCLVSLASWVWSVRRSGGFDFKH